MIALTPADRHIRQYVALDGCRGLAACLVALFHFRSVFRVNVNSHVGHFALVRNAWLGVDFFFVLSGFVIAANYQDRLISRSVRMRDFVLLRLGRLYPLHLLTLLATVLVVLFLRYLASGATRPDLPADQMSPAAFLANLFLVHGLHVGPTIMWNQWNHPSWSISAEFATYLIFALWWRVLRGYSRLLVWMTILVAPIPILLFHGSLDVTFDWGLLRAMLGFALGVVAFSAMRHPVSISTFGRLTRAEATLAELFLVLLAGALISLAGDTPFSIAAPFLFAGIVLLFAHERGIVTAALSSASARALGRWSYSIYLVHYPLQIVLMYAAVWVGAHGGHALFSVTQGVMGPEAVLGRSLWIGDAANIVMLGVLVVTSAGTYRLIEQPWRSRVRVLVYGPGVGPLATKVGPSGRTFA